MSGRYLTNAGYVAPQPYYGRPRYRDPRPYWPYPYAYPYPYPRPGFYYGRPGFSIYIGP